MPPEKNDQVQPSSSDVKNMSKADRRRDNQYKSYMAQGYSSNEAFILMQHALERNHLALEKKWGGKKAAKHKIKMSANLRAMSNTVRWRYNQYKSYIAQGYKSRKALKLSGRTLKAEKPAELKIKKSVAETPAKKKKKKSVSSKLAKNKIIKSVVPKSKIKKAEIGKSSLKVPIKKKCLKNDNASGPPADAGLQPHRSQRKENNVVRMGILPASFPEDCMTLDQKLAMEDRIVDAVLRHTDSQALKPSFKGYATKSGYVIVLCDNQTTADWVKAHEEELHLPDLRIRVVEEKEVPAPYILTGSFPRSSVFENEKIIMLIDSQNYGVNAASWRILRRENTGKNLTSVTLVFAVDPCCLEALRQKEFRISYRLGSINLVIRRIKVPRPSQREEFQPQDVKMETSSDRNDSYYDKSESYYAEYFLRLGHNMLPSKYLRMQGSSSQPGDKSLPTRDLGPGHRNNAEPNSSDLIIHNIKLE